MNNEAEGLEATLKLNEDIIVVRQSGGILEQPGLFAQTVIPNPVIQIPNSRGQYQNRD